MPSQEAYPRRLAMRESWRTERPLASSKVWSVTNDHNAPCNASAGSSSSDLAPSDRHKLSSGGGKATQPILGAVIWVSTQSRNGHHER